MKYDMARTVGLYLVLILGLMFIDQVTKKYAMENFVSYEESVIQHKGVKFDFATIIHERDAETFPNSSVLVGLLLVAVFWTSRLPRLAVCLWTAGACSNLIELYFNDGVVDFLAFDVGNDRCVIANLADMFIMAGLAILIVEFARERCHALEAFPGTRFIPEKELAKYRI